MSNKLKLMYVDDEIMNLKLFELNFNKQYEVITAGSGIEALKLLEKHLETVIVVSDMKMPEMSGIEFIKIAKEKYSRIVFFILTGYDISDEIVEALDSKLILKYFRKPYNYDEIDTEFKTVPIS
jgi:two-component system, response regulator, stage 0 sporulation protein F